MSAFLFPPHSPVVPQDVLSRWLLFCSPTRPLTFCVSAGLTCCQFTPCLAIRSFKSRYGILTLFEMIDCNLANVAYRFWQQLIGEHKPLVSILIVNSFSIATIEVKGNQKLGNDVWALYLQAHVKPSLVSELSDRVSVCEHCTWLGVGRCYQTLPFLFSLLQFHQNRLSWLSWQSRILCLAKNKLAAPSWKKMSVCESN